jgi:hypothetical protein
MQLFNRRHVRPLRRPGDLLEAESIMALAGKGAIIIWNDIAPEGRDEFYNWHIHEHIPERLGVPGFLRGSRYMAISPQTKPEFVTLYEITDASVATSAAYLARLNAPTEWTKRATSHFRNTARALTEVLVSEGAGPGGVMATIRFDDTNAAALAKLRDQKAALTDIARTVRITGVHLCATNNAASAAKTAESRDRTDILPAPVGAVLIEACDEPALRSAVTQILRLCGAEAAPLSVGFYRLEHARSNFAAAASGDVQGS